MDLWGRVLLNTSKLTTLLSHYICLLVNLLFIYLKC